MTYTVSSGALNSTTTDQRVTDADHATCDGVGKGRRVCALRRAGVAAHQDTGPLQGIFRSDQSSKESERRSETRPAGLTARTLVSVEDKLTHCTCEVNTLACLLLGR